MGDTVLDEVTPLFESFPTLTTAEYPLWAGGVTVRLPALAFWCQAVAAEMPSKAGEVGEGFTTFTTVVKRFWFGLAR